MDDGLMMMDGCLVMDKACSMMDNGGWMMDDRWRMACSMNVSKPTNILFDHGPWISMNSVFG